MLLGRNAVQTTAVFWLDLGNWLDRGFGRRRTNRRKRNNWHTGRSARIPRRKRALSEPVHHALRLARRACWASGRALSHKPLCVGLVGNWPGSRLMGGGSRRKDRGRGGGWRDCRWGGEARRRGRTQRLSIFAFGYRCRLDRSACAERSLERLDH